MLNDFFKRVSVLVLSIVLSGCVAQMNSTWPAIASKSKDQIRFDFPDGDLWEVAGQEHDAGGYSRSWKPLVKQGAAAEQGLYINFGRKVTTSLTESMHQVENAMRAGGCGEVKMHVWARGRDYLTFTAMARSCQNGRPVWQIFRVVNRPDGQYAMVYSANPDTVPVATRQQMAQTVEMSSVVPQASSGVL